MDRMTLPAAAVLAALAALCVTATAQEKKPSLFTLVNKSKDIRVLSDKDETVPDYFRRHRLIVGMLPAKEVEAAIEAKSPREKVFVNYTSHNDDPKKEQLFGDILKLAPLSKEAAALLREHGFGGGKKPFQVGVILRRDAADAELYHVVGWTGRSSVSFFASDKRVGGDDFSPRDLRFQGEKK